MKYDEELQIKTQKILKDKAADTFLWVALVVEQLRHAAHWQVDDILQEMLEGLDSLYAYLRQRVFKPIHFLLELLISILTTAERLLLVEELCTFMSYPLR